MEWKLTGSEPVYQQIMEHFRHAVLTGEYQPGARIPSVRELAAAARVNPNTMQRALAELEREGLLTGHGTQGRIVTVDAEILEELRRKTVKQTVLHCAALLQSVGLTLDGAAQWLENENREVG